MVDKLSVTDKKITTIEANRLMSSMELDLIAYFKVLENDILKALENYKGDDPQEIIDEVLGFLEDKDEGQIIEKGGLPIGTKRRRKDGLIYVKQPDGSWEMISEESDKEKEKITEHNIPSNVNPETKKQAIEGFNKIKNDYPDLVDEDLILNSINTQNDEKYHLILWVSFILKTAQQNHRTVLRISLFELLRFLVSIELL